MEHKLDAGQKHLLRLVASGADKEGWAPVSALVFPLVDKMPRELVEVEPIAGEGRGRVRLTVAGKTVLDWM